MTTKSLISDCYKDLIGYNAVTGMVELRCPHCKEEDISIRYERRVTQYGDLDLDSGSLDGDDYDDQEDYTKYFCSECMEEIDNDLIQEVIDENERLYMNHKEMMAEELAKQK